MATLGSSGSMNRWIIVLAWLLLTACTKGQHAVVDDYSATPGEESVISEAQIPSITLRAEDGDLHAVHKLILHYIAVGGAHNQTKYWTDKAVQLGDTSSMLDLAGYLITEGGADNCDRAQNLIFRARRETESERVVERSRVLEKLLLSCEPQQTRHPERKGVRDK